MIKYIAYCRKSLEDEGRQVLSIISQQTEIKEFAKRENLEIIAWFTEAKTAKKPGRVKFEEMMKTIESGKADGIVAWNPDRLARNSVDGGRIIYDLDTGKIKDLKFPTFWFEDTSQGKFMLSIAFGQSKYYVDNLSENVKRGIRQKLRRGVYPGLAPIGYLNDPVSRTVVPDPKRWKFIKRGLEEYSQGKHSMASLSKLMFSWGFTNRFGKPLNLSTIQNFLMNPFYYGVIRYAGEFYEGTHKTMITKSTFDKIQEVLKQRGKPRKKRIHNFPFLGLMKCSECGAAITAQIQKGHHYYNCTKKKGHCSQKYLREEALVEQIRNTIRKVAISDLWAKKILESLNKEEEADREKAMEVLTNLKSEIAELDKKIDKLLEAYLENIVSVEEYQTKKQNLIEMKSQIKQKIAEIEETQSFWLEPARKFILSCQEAKIIAETQKFGELFVYLQKVGANFLLSDKKVRFSWQEPYNFLAAEAGAAKNSTWSGTRELNPAPSGPKPDVLPMN